MLPQRTESLIRDYKNLVESVQKDMQLVCSTAASNRKLLKENPSLIDDDYKKCSAETISKLFETKSKLQHQLNALREIALSTEPGEIQDHREEFFESRRTARSRTYIPELKILQNIFSDEEVPSSSTANARGRSRRTVDDVQVVEDIQEDSSRLDPLTRCPIKFPVRNKRCKHYYCYESIIGYIRGIDFPRCPIAGCGLPHIREDDLEFVS